MSSNLYKTEVEMKRFIGGFNDIIKEIIKHDYNIVKGRPYAITQVYDSSYLARNGRMEVLVSDYINGQESTVLVKKNKTRQDKNDYEELFILLLNHKPTVKSILYPNKFDKRSEVQKVAHFLTYFQDVGEKPRNSVDQEFTYGFFLIKNMLNMFVTDKCTHPKGNSSVNLAKFSKISEDLLSTPEGADLMNIAMTSKNVNSLVTTRIWDYAAQVGVSIRRTFGSYCRPNLEQMKILLEPFGKEATEIWTADLVELWPCECENFKIHFMDYIEDKTEEVINIYINGRDFINCVDIEEIKQLVIDNAHIDVDRDHRLVMLDVQGVIDDVDYLNDRLQDYNIDDLSIAALPTPCLIEKKVTKKEINNALLQGNKRSNNRRKYAKSKLRKELLKKSKSKHHAYWKNNNGYRQELVSDRTVQLYLSMCKVKARGNAFQGFESDIQIDEAFQLFSHLDNPPVNNEDDAIGRPQIYRETKININAATAFGPDVVSLRDHYEYSKNVHIEGNFHHPESGGTKDFVPALECLFDLLASATRVTDDVKEAYHLMQTWMFDWNEDGMAVPKKKFSNLNPAAVVYFISQVKKRGLYNNKIPNIGIDRDSPMCNKDLHPYEILDIVKNYGMASRTKRKEWLHNVLKSPKVKNYLKETHAHVSFVNHEMRWNRLHCFHDNDKYHLDRLLLYVWQWHYPKALKTLTPTNDRDPQPGPSGKPEDGSAQQSTSSNEDCNPFGEGKDKVSTKGFVSELFGSVQRKATDLASGVFQPMTSSIDNITKKITEMLLLAEGFIDKIISSLTSCMDKFLDTGKSVVIKVASIVQLLGAYLLYQNTTNKFMKAAAVWFIFDSLRVGDLLRKGFAIFLEWRTNANREEIKDEEAEPVLQGTSEEEQEESISFFSSVLDNITKMDYAFIGKLAGIIIGAICGVAALKGFKTSQFGEKIVSSFKNFHFIGAGLFGLERIGKYCSAIFTAIIDYVKSFFKKEEASNCQLTEKELEEVRTKIAKMDMMLNYTVSSIGADSVRKSVVKQTEAKDLYSAIIMLKSDIIKYPNKYPSDLKRVTNSWNKAIIDLLALIGRAQAAAKPRNTPFHIQLYGQAGIGKSTLINKMNASIVKRMYPDMPVNASTYSPNNQDKFWPGYCGQPIVNVDEMYPILEAEVLVEWLVLISNLPVMVPMAELADKIQYFTSEWVLSCTNVPYPRANGVACVEAVWRRRHMFTKVTCDEDVINESTHKFDKQLFEKKYPGQDTYSFPHLKFHICKPIPGTSATGDLPDDGVPYMDNEILPSGLSQPLHDLTYEQYMEKVYQRRAVMVQEEESMRQEDRQDSNFEVASIWEDFLEAKSKEKVPFTSSPFFDLNKPEPSETIRTRNNFYRYEANIVKDEVVDEQAKQEEEVKKNLEDVKKNNNNADMLVVVDQTHYKLSLYEGKFQVFIRRQDTNLFTELSLSALTEVEKQSFATVVDEKSCLRPHIESMITGVPVGTTTSDSGEDLAELERKLARYKLTGKNKYMIDKVQDRINYLKGLKTEQTKEPDVQKDKIFGFEYLNMLNKQPIVQPGTPETGTKLCEHGNDDYLTRTSDFYCDIHNVDFTSLFIHVTDETVKYDRPVLDNEYMCGYKYRKNFFLTQKEIEDLKIPMTSENTGMNMFYLSKFVKLNGKWWFKFDDECRELIARDFKIPAQKHPLILNNDPYFIDTVSIFMSLPDRIKDYIMAEYTKMSRSMYSAFKTRAELNSRLLKRVGDIMDKVLKDFIAEYGEILTILKRALYLIGSAVAIIYTFRQISSFFSPPKVEETSKIMFKRTPILKNLQTTAVDCPIENENHEKAVLKNLLSIKYEDKKSNGFGICGNLFTVNLHLLPEIETIGPEGIILNVKRTNNILAEYSPVRIYKEQIYVLKDKDVVFINNPVVGCFKDLSANFARKSDSRKPFTMSLCYNKDDATRIQTLVGTPLYNYNYISDATKKRERLESGFQYGWNAPKGSSGGVIINGDTSSRQFILGFQCFTDGKTSYSNSITQEDLQRVVNKIGTGILTEGPHYCEDELTPTSELIVTDEQVVGSVPDNMILGAFAKSTFIKTPIHKFVPESKRVPAILDPFDARVPVGTHPLQHSINKYGRDVIQPFDRDIMQHTTEQFALYYKNRIRSAPRTLSDEEVILGIRGMKCEPVNTKTSPGIPLVYGRTLPGKKDFIRINEEGEIEFIADEIMDTMKEWEKLLKQGIIPAMSAYEFPKDELRPIEKVLACKTRSIRVLPLVLNLIYRKYNLAMDAAIREMADGNHPICVGINPESLAWDMIYRNMKKISDYAADYDVGNWDGHFCHELKQAVNEFRHIIDERDDLIILRESLSQAITHGYVQFLDTVIQMNRGLGSGYAGTTDENCIGHSLLILYIVNKILWVNHKVKISYKALRNYFCFYVYGDDIIITIHSDLLPFVSYEQIVEEYEYYGWPITSADKQSTKTVKSTYDTLFLKRTPKPLKVGNQTYIVGALDKGVIYDLCYWIRATRKDEIFAQLRDNINSATEFMWAHGKSATLEFKEIVDEALKKAGLKMRTPSWQIVDATMKKRLFSSDDLTL